ncbi:NB-ARC domain-containing protein [filamentous cyanobacterium CCP2]|nr:NB-ARC domain-containing protein [filamentous cyanobacterium CCP2]
MATSSPHLSEDLFSDASQHWDLDRLCADLATIKQRPLTVTERACLRGLLCSINPNDIAAALHRQPQGLRVDLTRGLYRYVEGVSCGAKPKNWREVPILLSQNGYRKQTRPVALPLPSDRPIPQSPISMHHDWGNAPDVSIFFGRSHELKQLQQWIVKDQCQIVAIWGMQGMGKTRLSVKLAMGNIGKTELSLQVAQGVQEQFEFVIWRSLYNAPSLKDLLIGWLKGLSGQQEFTAPKDIKTAIHQLISYLKSHRCLLILDNVERILQPESATGQYLAGYEEYGQLFQQIGTIPHQSCLLLTSRETLHEVVQLENKTSVRSLALQGLDIEAGKQIFAEIGNFSATESEWQQIVELYNGNPLALELIAKHIEYVFDGNITDFLQEGTPLFLDRMLLF